MPGLKRSPGLADIDVCNGAFGAGYGGLEQVRKASLRNSDGTPVQRTNSVDRTYFTEPAPRSAPALDPQTPSDDGDSSEPEIHAGFENRITRPPQAKALDLNDSGLPPTPPTLTNSDVAEAKREEHLTPPALFADGVRNALQSQKSGLSLTPVNQLSPPTPDPSPPTTTENLPALSLMPAMEQKEKPQFLQPIIASSVAQHLLRQYPSSRAESFRTAREDPAMSPDGSMSQVHLPADDALPEHWLDSTRALDSARIGLGDITASETPKVAESEDKASTPKASKRRSRHESPPHLARSDSDWEKHISYVSGPDELDTYAVPEEDAKQPVAGLGLSGAGLPPDVERSAEDFNNMVYKRIQEENVKRHSAISANSGAITVGIVVPPSDSTPRTLKRQTKCGSLRGDASSTSKRNSGASERKLSHKKVRLPEKKTLDQSPVFESSIRQVSSPARLGLDASNMTALTFASMQDSPSMKRVSRFPSESDRKLRHLSYQDRLANNMSVRRTSLEASPPQARNEFEILREPVYAPKRTSASEKIMNNMAVKRSSTAPAKPSQPRGKSPNKIRGVIPSVESEPEAWSLSTRLRRFSREERLENNDNVRRTSLEHGVQPEPRPESISRRHTGEKFALPSSPRKSLDARFLHPTTTPMSTSQFSDRTEVELCEASGVRLYPHNNDSLLVVQHGSRPVSKDKDIPDIVDERLRALGKPIFAAQVDPPTPVLSTSEPANHVDSPLTNPRQAPEPPVIKFIPPTPNSELEKRLSGEGTIIAEVNLPPRRLSLVQRARRYSDSLIARAGSLRRPKKARREHEGRDTYLSPLWRPQGFWDDFDSEDEDDFEPIGALPRGGDTSNVGEGEEQRRQKTLFPRTMSKRLPGFRGTGGFLVGNSLGLDRHGTNNRRHYVSTGSRTLSKRASEERLKSLSSGLQQSDGSIRRIEGVRGFKVPFTGGMRAKWVGTQRFRARMRRIRTEREEKQKEKRRERLRSAIGYRVYHETSGC